MISQTTKIKGTKEFFDFKEYEIRLQIYEWAFGGVFFLQLNSDFGIYES